MKFVLKICLTLIALITFAHAGNGSSGGGHIYGDQINPWFVQNTKTVYYCVNIGATFSDLPAQRIYDLIEQAFGYWKQEFKAATEADQDNVDFKPAAHLATQQFVLSSCDQETDIQFQLGQLTEVQKQKLGNTEQIIGNAYRDSYDPQTLKGKGFIYIAPEKGELRPVSVLFAAKPWSYGQNNALLYSLIHELGHVFGLPDVPTENSEVMSRQFLETLTSKKIDPRTLDYILGSKKHKFFKPLGFDGKFNAYYKMDISTSSTEVGAEIQKANADKLALCKLLDIECPKDTVSLFIDGKGTKVDFYIVDKNNRKKLAGTFDLNTGSQHSANSSFGAPSIWLSREQKVFKVSSHLLERTIWLYSLPAQGTISNVLYRSVNGKEGKFQLNFPRPSFMEIGAVINGEFHPDIFSM